MLTLLLPDTHQFWCIFPHISRSSFKQNWTSTEKIAYYPCAALNSKKNQTWRAYFLFFVFSSFYIFCVVFFSKITFLIFFLGIIPEDIEMDPISMHCEIHADWDRILKLTNFKRRIKHFSLQYHRNNGLLYTTITDITSRDLDRLSSMDQVSAKSVAPV